MPDIADLLTCVYISVVFEDLCPSNFCMYRKSVPYPTNHNNHSIECHTGHIINLNVVFKYHVPETLEPRISLSSRECERAS